MPCLSHSLSWDAASWHISKKLLAHLKELNKHAKPDGYPVIKTAPLPAGAQFLNVIESVFSGMARAIIHNSDYPSVEAAKEAIDVYFSERNAHFSKHPKRRGKRSGEWSACRANFAKGKTAKTRCMDSRRSALLERQIEPTLSQTISPRVSGSCLPCSSRTTSDGVGRPDSVELKAILSWRFRSVFAQGAAITPSRTYCLP